MKDTSGKISGFSKLSAAEKRRTIAEHCLGNAEDSGQFEAFHFADEALQQKFEQFSENTLTNHALPFGVIPNVLVDDKLYHVPAVVEESSVVAAASKAASFWYDRGGFKTIAQESIKNGQVYFEWFDDVEWLRNNKSTFFDQLAESTAELTNNMEKRGGGIRSFLLEQMPGISKNTLKLTVEVNTADSMGANFINSLLETIATEIPVFAQKNNRKAPEVLMAILSNYTPKNFVTMQVAAPIEQMTWSKLYSPEIFAKRFVQAVNIANTDVSRAVTHNKGIMNGSDAVILATGNDFRAAEAAAHAFAARNGSYASLSEAVIENGYFSMKLTLPVALGTVGGLTKLHPTAALALNMLGNPGADELMKIVASAGLANNFAAVASLVTTGIQRGHMKLHLDNILSAEKASPTQIKAAKVWFTDKTVSVSAVREFLANSR
ncbi:MAG TPA: hypothetical protein VJ937_12735 [Salinivirga sp.]|uniref:hypothetical protein n=1 Tax=Salinivirga sp. TaxID=1970192 RepID=UPI002B48D0A0|nr:hypothetical protein [Salinivirga sp.]HKK60338.1 hypothetical protein [Salinivirga sp.]